MNKDVAVVIKLLKEHVDANECLLDEASTKQEMEDLKTESASCCRVIHILENLEG